MRHETNAEFVSAIQRELEGVKFFSVGACPGCADCGLDHITDADDDPHAVDCANDEHFSWSECESCRSSLGGSRHPAHGFITDADGNESLVHFDVCVDCAMFHANGELPFDDETVE